MGKIIRYRKPSLNNILGVTKAKRRVKKAAGVYKVTKTTNAPSNYKRKVKRKAGYESGIMKFFRFLQRKSR